jgi:hypothetical protein
MDHVFSGIVAIMSILTFWRALRVERKQNTLTKSHNETVVAIAENKAAIAQTKTAIDDNTAITKELGTEMNGRMTELVAVNRSQAKQEGVVQEQAAQAARDIASH